jgi:hypothetical protein
VTAKPVKLSRKKISDIGSPFIFGINCWYQLPIMLSEKLKPIMKKRIAM